MSIGNGLILTTIGLGFFTLAIVLGYREYKESQRIIKQSRESWRKCD
jgi:multisubunit Na+/H+ antiporter MnhC subunit